MTAKIENVKPDKEIVLRREWSINKLGFEIDSPQGRLIIAMTDTFFMDGARKAAKEIAKII